MSNNGSVAAVPVRDGDEGDIWVCNRCGWTYPNRHPSARHRRNHRKHCGKVKGFEAALPQQEQQQLQLQQQRDGDQAGGSSDNVSSDEERESNHRQEQEKGGTAAAAAVPAHTQRAAGGNVEEKDSGTTVTPIEDSIPDDASFDPRQDAAADPEHWEQLLDAHVTETNGNAIHEHSQDGTAEDVVVNPFVPQSPVIHEQQQKSVPESSQAKEVPVHSEKNPFLQVETGVPEARQERAEASSSASWESIRPHVALKSLFDEDRATKRPEAKVLDEEEEEAAKDVPPMPPKRTNSNVLMKVIDNVRNSPAKFGGGGGGARKQNQQQQHGQQRRSWWSNCICCTPRIS